MMCVYVTCDVVPNATLMHVLISYDELTFQRLHVLTSTYYPTPVCTYMMCVYVTCDGYIHHHDFWHSDECHTNPPTNSLRCL